MSATDLVQKLNNTVSKLRAETEQKYGKNDLSITFACGNFNSDLIKFITDIAPSGKVFILCTRESYDKYGKHVAIGLSAINREYVDVIMSGENLYSVDRISGIFNVGDDARVVLTFDYALYGVVSYFASIRNLPCVCAVDSLAVKNILSPTVELINGDVVDKVKVDCQKFVYINEQLNQANKAVAYAHVLSNVSGLIDYRIARALSKQDFSKQAYVVARESVYSAYAVMKHSLEQQAEQLLYCSLALELANAYSNGLIYGVSACECASKLISDNSSSEIEKNFFTSLALIQIYHAMFSVDRINVLEYPDALSRVEEICKVYPLSKESLIKGLIEQGAMIKRHKPELKEITQKVKTELGALAKCVPVMRQTYYALGGQSKVLPEDLKIAVKYSGDLTEHVNGVSVLREWGVTELL